MKIEQIKKNVEPEIKFYDGICLTEFKKLLERWKEILSIVHQEIEKYVNDDDVCFHDHDNLFPVRSRITGHYYIDCVSYMKHVNPIGFRILVNIKLTEPTPDGEDDYLGLDVTLFTHFENDIFEVWGIDSSSI